MNGSIWKLLNKQGELITRSQALRLGVTPSMLKVRLRPGGPWRVVLPGVYLAHNGPLNPGQRDMAAALYAGRGSLITGLAALRALGVRVPDSDQVDVLIPAGRKRGSVEFVRVHRTRKMPDRVLVIEEVGYVEAARAVADATRGHLDLKTVTGIVAAAVQKRSCTVAQVAAELKAGPQQGSAALRAAVGAVADGVRSVAESDFRTLITKSDLPAPMYNPKLFAGLEFVAKPDAWWGDAGVAAEVDSREWHFSPADWERTMARHARMTARGILVLHFPPRRISTDGTGVVRELREALESGRRRPPLQLRVVPAA